MNVNRIWSDIETAKHLMSPFGNPTNDEYLYDVAAYHTQQAIEKSIKYFLHDVYGEDDTTREFKTHNLNMLLNRLQDYEPDFNADHPKLIEMAYDITLWEANSRYGDDISAVRSDIEAGIQIAEELYGEVMEKARENDDRDDHREPDI